MAAEGDGEDHLAGTSGLTQFSLDYHHFLLLFINQESRHESNLLCYRFSWEDRMTEQEEWKLQKVCLKIQFSALELDFRVQVYQE